MPRTYKSVDKAEQILKGALPQFLQNGYARTSMDRIASSAGVSKQTLYSHFSDKDGLFQALIEHMATRKFQLVWSKPLEGEPEEVLRGLAERILSEVNETDHVAFFRLIVAESRERPDLGELLLKNIAKPAMKILTEYFQAHPELNFKDPEAIARIFVGSLIHFILTQEIFGGKKFMPIESDRIVDSLIDLVLIRK
ncbi:MAG: TetR/AcrR family transcriptional regulator [Prochloraceae cyanobacterium]|nr:TetR/AcrR family transcriptional regulator [Prochloraceae cyanobacterium]